MHTYGKHFDRFPKLVTQTEHKMEEKLIESLDIFENEKVKKNAQF